MTSYAIRDVPKLTISKGLRRPPPKHDPSKEYQFRYRSKKHSSLPHVVKFSGGRSSGMLLFALLENGTARRRPWRRHRLQQHLRRASGYLSVRPRLHAHRSPVRNSVLPGRVPDVRGRPTGRVDPAADVPACQRPAEVGCERRGIQLARRGVRRAALVDRVRAEPVQPHLHETPEARRHSELPEGLARRQAEHPASRTLQEHLSD